MAHSDPHLTRHARERAKEMKVDLSDVIAAVVRPEVEYRAFKYPGCRVALSGPLCIPFDPSTGSIISVLWRGKESR